jgi:hypothetical protein
MPRAKRTYGVEVAVELFELAEAMLRQRLRRERPRISQAALEAEVTRWRLARPGAEHGDAAGRPVAWPRRARR